MSGGQKQRINIARALYFGSDITLFDDSFSALDAHVGQSVFDNVLRAGGALDGRTRVLVTHKLNFLPHVDYIITLADGKITEQGTYVDLMAANGFFAKFINEFGGAAGEGEGETEVAQKSQKAEAVGKPEAKSGPAGKVAMMQNEERATGSVNWKSEHYLLHMFSHLRSLSIVYKAYFVAAKIEVVFPLLILAIMLFQGASVLSPYWYAINHSSGLSTYQSMRLRLVWWQET